MKLDIGILCSGNLGLHCLKEIYSRIKPQFIFTDRNSLDIIEFAKKKSIPIFIGNPNNDNSAQFLTQFSTDLILSINYLYIVNKQIINHPKRNAINLHGSILPKYRGRTPHVWAIINGEKETGITAHLLEEGCDTGDIVLQEIIDITPDLTGADILEIFKTKYPLIILKILDQLQEDKITRIVQDDKNATYFGKRNPQDGKIIWDWQKERIHNWVRAQAYPYPGAFTTFRGEKIIIDKIRFSDIGFEYNMPNGLILKTSPCILVKTPNGLVELVEIRNRSQLNFSINQLFE